MTQRETELTERLARCESALAESRQENALLRQKIDLLVRRVFGSSSETLDPAQMELLMALPAAATVVEAPVNPSPKSPLFVRAKTAHHACPTTCPWSKK